MGTMSYRTEGGISIRLWGGRGSLGGEGAWKAGVWGAGGLEPGGMGRMDVSLFGQTFVHSDGQMDGWKFPPLFYRTSAPSGPLPCLNFSILKKTVQGQ